MSHLDHEQSLFFPETIEQNARDMQMFTRVIEGARALPSINLKKKRNCSQAMSHTELKEKGVECDHLSYLNIPKN